MVKTIIFVALTIWIVTAGCFVYLPAAWAAPPNLPSQSNVLAVMNKVAEYAQRHYSVHVAAHWDDGVYHMGMMALHHISDDTQAFAYTETFGDYNNWTLVQGGSPYNQCGVRTSLGNRHNRLAAAQSWLEASQTSPELVDLNDTYRELDQQTYVLSLADVTSEAYFAVDAQFMALPAFVKVGALKRDNGYFDRMYELFHYTKTRLGLYDTAAHLYYRDQCYISDRSPNGKKVFWSRGNGWALGALARILQELPTTDPHYNEYVTTFQQMSAALKAVQRPDGFWNMSLYDPNHYGGPETSGTALFVYGMAWGIRNGLLDATTYLPVVVKAWNAMVATAVHASGKLGYVQGVGKDPVPTDQVTYESSADFGVGAFLLAGSEVLKLSNPCPCAHAYSDQQAGNPAANAIDGDLNNRWSALSYPQWIEIDLLRIGGV